MFVNKSMKLKHYESFEEVFKFIESSELHLVFKYTSLWC